LPADAPASPPGSSRIGCGATSPAAARNGPRGSSTEKGAIDKFLHSHLQDPRQTWMHHDRSYAAQRVSRREGGGHRRAASLSRDDVMALELDETPVMWLRAWDERRLCCTKWGLSGTGVEQDSDTRWRDMTPVRLWPRSPGLNRSASNAGGAMHGALCSSAMSP
jgi:hypothetical protein